MADTGGDRLVAKEFWEQEYYWAHERPPVRPDPELAFDRAMMRALERLAPASHDDRVLEVGCAPAKWLGFYGERFGATVDGIEYSEKGARLSQATLDALGVRGEISCVDFFDAPVREQYDLVLSFGFIEHFDDVPAVFRRHLEFVRPGGRLVIGVPNFRGLNRLLQRWADPAYLALHNLAALEPKLYRRLGHEQGLELIQQRYVGGPDPIIIKHGRRWVTPLVLAEARLRRVKATEQLNSGLVSPYLLTVFRTRAS